MENSEKKESFVEKLIHMKTLTHMVSDLSVSIQMLAAYPAFYLIMGPTFLELCMVILADQFAWLYRNIDRKVLLKIYPQFEVLFSNFNFDEPPQMTRESKSRLLETLMDFPKTRAKYVAKSSWLAVTPAMGIIMFVWEYDRSMLEQFTLMTLLIGLNFAFFYGSTLIETHIFCSRLIKKLAKADQSWEEVFRTENISSNDSTDFGKQALISFLAIFLLVLSLQVTIAAEANTNLIPKLLFTLSVGAIMATHLAFQYKRFFVEGFRSIFKAVDSVTTDSIQSIPFHSSSVLAGFEKSFNRMSHRLKQADDENKVLVENIAEKTELETVGLISTHLCHDIRALTHRINAGAKSLEEKGFDSKYADQFLQLVNASSDELVEFVQNMTDRFRAPVGSDSNLTAIKPSIDAAIKTLKLKYGKKIDSIDFKFNGELDDIVHFDQIDLKRICYNLLDNSVRSQLLNNVSHPLISISSKSTDSFVSIYIEDNGPGLSKKQFDELTNYTSDKTYRKSLGLRLCKKIIELNKGSLSLIEKDGASSGTLLSISLLKATDLQLEELSKKVVVLQPAQDLN